MNKKYSIILLIFAALIGIYFVASTFFGKEDKKSEVNKNVDTYSVSGKETSKFNGKVVIGKEQKIFLDQTKGEVKDLKKDNKDSVKKGETIFVYHNPELESEISDLNKSIEKSKKDLKSLNNGSNKGDITKYKNELSGVENSLNQKQSEMQNEGENSNKEAVSSEINNLLQKKATLEGKIAELQMGVDGNKAEVKAMEEAIKTQQDQLEKLKNNQRKEVKSNIDGVIYVDEDAHNDITKPYIRIISSNSLIKGKATEFNVGNLSIDQPVLVKNINTNKFIKGSINKIDDLPIVGEEASMSSYEFFVSPEEEFRVGTSVEIILDYKNIKIPKEYVTSEKGKFYVTKQSEKGTEKVEIQAILEGDNYYLVNSSISVGSKIIKDKVSDKK